MLDYGEQERGRGASRVRRRGPFGSIAALVCSIQFCLGAPALAAPAEVVVITSFPSTLYEPFRRAFESRDPEIRLRILNRKTTAAIAMVADGRFDGADVFWASAPDAFAVLSAGGQLALLPRSGTLPRPKIGGFGIDDPNGAFRGFTVSGYGITWNRELLARAGIDPPIAIAELVHPRYRGLLAMSAPSRSGTTHLMVETVLQRQGWKAGWETWLAIAGNLAAVTARSFSVSSGVAQGRFAIGLSIDFLGRGREGGPVGFAYPVENVFLPGSIAVLRHGRQPEAARRFAAFVLSEEGQRLLTDPQIARHPVLALDGLRPEPDLFRIAEKDRSGFVFDANLSGRRYELVNVLFDELITERLARLQRFWRLHAEIGGRLEGRAELAAQHREVARLGRELPPEIAALEADGAWIELRRTPRGAPAPAEQTAFLDRIRASAESKLAAAETALDRLAARLASEDPAPLALKP